VHPKSRGGARKDHCVFYTILEGEIDEGEHGIKPIERFFSDAVHRKT
jgi:hypothetical protein